MVLVEYKKYCPDSEKRVSAQDVLRRTRRYPVVLVEYKGSIARTQNDGESRRRMFCAGPEGTPWYWSNTIVVLPGLRMMASLGEGCSAPDPWSNRKVVLLVLRMASLCAGCSAPDRKVPRGIVRMQK